MSEAKLPDIHDVHAAFISAAVARLRQQEERILICLNQLTEEQVWQRLNQNSNSVGNLMLHLMGNLGQWVISGVGNEPDTRDRDLEFSTEGGITRAELASRFHARLDHVIRVIEAVGPERLLEGVVPQGYALPVMEVITHITEHFYHHGGQIFLLTKLYLDVDLAFYKHLANNNKQHSETVP